MDLSAIIYKNVSKCCTVQKSVQINHRNIYTRYSIFSVCAVCQFVTYTPAQGSARKQYIQYYLLPFLSQSCLYLHVSLEYSTLHNYTVTHSYLSHMNFNQDVLLNFHILISHGILIFLSFNFISYNCFLQFFPLLALCWMISSPFH